MRRAGMAGHVRTLRPPGAIWPLRGGPGAGRFGPCHHWRARSKPAVDGKGAAILRQAGICVDWADHGGCLAHHRGFNRRIRGGAGKIILKIATSHDGGMYKWADQTRTLITGPETQAQVHLLRAQSDVIVTGRGTMERDHPRFTVRLPGYPVRSPPSMCCTGAGCGAPPPSKSWWRRAPSSTSLALSGRTALVPPAPIYLGMRVHPLVLRPDPLDFSARYFSMPLRIGGAGAMCNLAPEARVSNGREHV